MTDKKTYDPYDSIKKYSELWEKQINDFIFLLTNNSNFVKMANLGTEGHSRYFEKLRKNQESVAGLLNFPTKNDVANVANLTIQAEEKMGALEEQIWDLKDSMKSQSKEIETVVDVSKEIIKLTKQLKTELLKTKKELADTKDLHAELQEMKFELIKLNDLKDEFEILKSLIKNEKETEQALVGTTQSK
ncbi:polyhydroxyalkanoate biosynthesis repressor PhaR [Neobacillus ginsengisoli]|uniref:Vacuolar-type H+-ATPase subunit I/STV1 n=1 Tax=Neobacillus ginsengisoli TaxID=904295 RepID=A0ABT9XRY1_9BACI|nr:polyhydroxyalkanoate biosynthesis repressor PhaR [Neobacillus ginsengisoli]MDQ0198318.1 vacuolar-type H+-ATPase subunit I/STV1 [Neobacillus ginsengisoli]